MIGIISDIHGNYTALLEVLNSLDAMGIKDIYCLGDVVGYYSQINECCVELRKRDIKCIMGNHDWYMVAKSFCPRSNSVNDCMKYQRTVIAKENFDWLSSLPIFRNIQGISMVHGGWCDPIDEYLDPQEEYFARITGKYFMSGHTHIQAIRKFGDKIYCNPGSVGQPRDNNPESAFATFDGENFFLHRVKYDVDQVGKLMDKAGFSGYYYGCLKTGSRNLQWAEE
ncbi:metallophosphoesterase family protein [Pelosinus propionicus]|uniref:Predicted phosphodiesterase n=1 Tax=Pelosinus propionicus DSM 13327 TaxID=1123291 RepID=A0A1I4HSW3_9FIRM|nr:metallophosphoesterase family protein [Pelosinus propionicus]SFL45299.1 Predicted phosphodiesterase [Pelosinus propionicus DSM 13327]